ncbi:hypothetical protein [Calidifontibacter indicus]|uniref:hypothetical protein n=1 Tax=Calidifontibacter indicus TaxID=419650 RepID=UPI001B86D19D|nr:hypothetical protein [Calidifontibacter indicus]
MTLGLDDQRLPRDAPALGYFVLRKVVLDDPQAALLIETDGSDGHFHNARLRCLQGNAVE